MISRFMFIILAVITAPSLALASGSFASGCGHSITSGGIMYYDSADQVQMNGGFSAYSCPAHTDPAYTEVVLRDINFETGTYSCLYSGESAPAPQRITYTAKAGCSKRDILVEMGSVVSVQAVNEGKIPDNTEDGIGYYIHNNSALPGSGYTTQSAKLLPLVTSEDALNQKLNSSREYGMVNESKMKDIKRPDSHSNSEATLPGVLTGVLTLDADYFDSSTGETRFINGLGEVTLNSTGSVVSVQPVEEGAVSGFFKTVSSYLYSSSSGAVGDPIEEEAKVFEPLSFVDKQLMGFYTYLTGNFKEVYTRLIYYFFLLGGAVALGKVGYGKFLARFADGRDDGGGGKKWAYAALGSFVFFTAPVSYDATNINIDGVAYENEQEIDSYAGYYTGSQEAIRFFGQLGTFFGNYLNDAGMWSYIRYLGYKQGLIDPSAYSYLTEAIRGASADSVILASKTNFLTGVCAPYFNEAGVFTGENYASSLPLPGDAASAFGNISSERALQLYTTVPDTNGRLSEIAGITGATRLNPDICIKLAQGLKRETDDLYYKIHTIQTSLANFDAVYDAKAASNQEYFNAFAKMLQQSADYFGWMSAATVPSSYSFYQLNEVFLYNTISDTAPGDGSAFTTAAKNQTNVDNLDSWTDYLEDGTATVLSGAMGNTAWFILPGFDKVYLFINSQLNSFVGKSDGSGKLMKVMKSIVVGGAAGPVGAVVAGVLSFASDAIITLVIAYVSLLVSTMLYEMLVGTMTVVIISSFLTFKIVMYFFEMILFFFTSPAIGLWGVMKSSEGGSGDYLRNFSNHIMFLAISPVLIVNIAYLILFLSEFTKSLFIALMGLLYAVLDDGHDMLTQVSGNGQGMIDSMEKVFMLVSLKSMTAVFAHFIILVIAVVLILNYREWFAKMVGLDAGIDTTKASIGEVRNTGGKYMTPV